MSKFRDVPSAPPIEAFTLKKIFEDDDFPQKVNTGIGVYRTAEAKPWVLPCVKQVELAMAQDDYLNHEYLPVLGMNQFCKVATNLLLGTTSPAILEHRAIGVQSLSGTGALRVGAEFLCRILKCETFYVSTPTWENHRLLFFNAGFKNCREYRYWDKNTRKIDIEGLIEDLSNAEPESVVVLHACAHNPTGCDPSKEEWKKIADVISEKSLIPFFDSAYQGFASGDPEEDAWAVRYFVSRDMELLCAQSFAKNFGLYNERVGNLTFVFSSPEVIPQVRSQVTLIVRGMYSNPPYHGARIVSTILLDPVLRNDWKECIKTMSGRIKDMRALFRDKLEKNGAPGNWEHITSQIGMFSYTGLNPHQCEYLISQYHIYLLKSGRISMSGLNPSNIDYVVNAICETLKLVP
ncbi:probable aspartate aminotransferase, cytoplasmic isoform X2 [Cimex lectularius]|uniref:Aspartate aminotransferase n=1 Tax=Cimex lectularius TaxID=79782 RepID=A0A8I6SI24_CIMLE|nr:probable aspartate aminotransferase, cytoplasmic isoform X2 [Cimex lectularius]